MYKLTFLLTLSYLNAFSSEFPIDAQNDPYKIIWDMGREKSKNIWRLEEISSRKAEVDVKPWSGYYWANATGGASVRNLDYGFQSILNQYNGSIPFAYPKLENYIYRSLGTGEASATEKYDLFIGDLNYSLTRTNLQTIRKQYKSYGKVPEWFGLCHGLAPASMMVDRPIKAVTVKGWRGEVITFTPSDIKALLSLIWANKKVDLIARRCERSYLSHYSSSRACGDLNPASFHLALMNQIGVNKKPFIVDRMATSEVWNHPVYKYEVDYYDVKSRYILDELSSNFTPINKISLNKRGRHRNTANVVGVRLRYHYVDVNYNFETMVDNASFDESKMVEVFYDLELDAAGNILGGEWISNNYPDFAWIPTRTRFAVLGEQLIPKMMNGSKINKGVRALAMGGSINGKRIEGNSKKLMPIPGLVNELVRRSRK